MFRLKRLFTFSILAFLASTLFSSEQYTINFAPLPTKKASKNIQDFLPMNAYLKKKLNIDVKYVYKNDYQDILDGFKNGTIDVALLGPLPYVSLKKGYEFAKPIITFKQKNGSSKYRCVISKFKEDKFDKNKQVKVALTQPLSTCGYLMTNILLKSEFGIELEKQKYKYTMSHTNALISVVKGEFLIAGAKEDITKQHKSLGIEIIGKSELLPGFSLVVNTKTLSKKQIDDIQKTILNVKKEIYKQWDGITSNGFEKSKLEDYHILNVDFVIPKKGNMK